MVNKTDGWEYPVKFSGLFICGLLGILFLFLSVAGILSTSVLDPANFVEEHILYPHDRVILNLLTVVAFLLLLKLLKPYAKSINPQIATLVLIAYTTLIGAVWVIAVKSVPAADSGAIVNAAKSFIKGSYAPLQAADSYFRYYPFQLSFTFICELLLRIFGTENYVALGIINLICLDAAYIALIQLAKLIFNNKKIELLTIFLLAGCLQPILFTTFIYGNIMGLAFAMWAVVFEILYIKTGKKYWMLISSVFIAIAVTAKLNYLIVLIAMSIILLLNLLKTKQGFNLLWVACAVALTLGCNQLILSGYESRAGTELGDGVPQILWTAMGLQESFMAPGWYNGYTIKAFKNNNFSRDAATRQAREDIQERLAYFSANPREALTFFINKVLSQWNEPSYESIWVSQVKKHQSPVPSFVENVYTGRLGQYLHAYFNIYQQIMLIGFFIALFSRLKKQDECFIFLPLIILGGFLYHLINEAKSQYILIYFVMLVPYAAYGFYTAVHSKHFNPGSFFNRRKVDNAANTQK